MYNGGVVEAACVRNVAFREVCDRCSHSRRMVTSVIMDDAMREVCRKGTFMGMCEGCGGGVATRDVMAVVAHDEKPTPEPSRWMDALRKHIGGIRSG